MKSSMPFHILRHEMADFGFISGCVTFLFPDSRQGECCLITIRKYFLIYY